MTEVWNSKEALTASLSIPSFGELITKARPLIADFKNRFETTPVGGIGIQSIIYKSRLRLSAI